MKRTLLLGLDGMSFTILDNLTQSGDMPFLKQFIENGVRGELISTICPVTPPAWTSIMTGRSPGNHGIFDFIHVDDECADRLVFRLTTARDVLCETIWSIAGRHGRTVGSLNFPQMFQAEPFNGYMVPGFVTSRHLRTGIQPREYWDRIKELPGFNAKDVAWDLDKGRYALGGKLEEKEFKEWIDYLVRKERGWFAIAHDLIKGELCDLVAVVFEGVDRLQHQSWHLLDPALLPKTLTPSEKKIREYSLHYFQELDKFLRILVESAGKDTQVFIVSDHGFGSTTEIFYTNMWLEKNGYLFWKEDVPCDDEGMLTAHNMRDHFDTIDWDKTTAYARTTSANGIYIRVAKKPGQSGIPPERYESFRSELVKALQDYKDPKTNTPVITKIVTREEGFPGRATEHAPDLTLILRDGGFISILRADDIIKQRPLVKGTHRPEGVFIAGGHQIKKGLEIQQHSLLNIAPTVLHSMNLAIPKDFEGKVTTEIFEPDFLKLNPVKIDESTICQDNILGKESEAGLKESDEAQILERLKDLGYFE